MPFASAPATPPPLSSSFSGLMGVKVSFSLSFSLAFSFVLSLSRESSSRFNALSPDAAMAIPPAREDPSDDVDTESDALTSEFARVVEEVRDEWLLPLDFER